VRIAALLYSRYIVASAIALACDLGLFLAALSLGTPAAIAAVLGYSAGICVHWLLSSRTVFVGHVSVESAARRHQQLLFLGSALVGLAITAGIVGMGDTLGVDPRLAKLTAVAISFHITYLLRRHFVFAC
jgi:putative flippase GtrA